MKNNIDDAEDFNLHDLSLVMAIALFQMVVTIIIYFSILHSPEEL